MRRSLSKTRLVTTQSKQFKKETIGVGGREPKNEPSARDVVPDERCVFFTS
eukprot:COSAG02_NODE_28739_length_583_cov_1.357438_1_plen_50_part_10